MKQSPVLDLFDGQEIAHPICSSPLVDVTLEQMDLCGSSYPEAPTHMATLAESAHTLAGFEGIRLFFDLCIEAEALGCGIKPPRRENPPYVVKPAVKNFEALTIAPDIFSRGRFGSVFEGFSFDRPTIRAETARETIGKKMIFIGNIPTKTLLLETAENVVRDAEAAMRGGVDLLAPACGVALQTPLANLKAMAQAVPLDSLDMIREWFDG